MQEKLFLPLPKEDAPERMVRPSTTYWQDAWRRLRENRGATVGLVVIALICLVAIVGPYFSPYSYSDQSLIRANRPPSKTNWLGTDNLGRDIATRLMYGARISLAIGVFASLINLTIGVVYGGIAGFFGGQVDNVMMRVVDILYGIPSLLYIILLMVVLGPGFGNILIAIGLTEWLSMARIVRGQILGMRGQDFALAARCLGASRWRILFRHLIPNSVGPIIVTATLTIPQAIFLEAFLSFIGLGVSAPMASWGVLASDGLAGIRSYPWQLLAPAFAISITMLAFNFLGDGLRDALDPRLRS